MCYSYRDIGRGFRVCQFVPEQKLLRPKVSPEARKGVRSLTQRKMKKILVVTGIVLAVLAFIGKNAEKREMKEKENE